MCSTTLHALLVLPLSQISQRKQTEVISRLPTMMGNNKISFSRHEGIFQNNASNNLSITEGNVMNMEMDKQGRNIRNCVWKKYDSVSSIYQK
jgi:hypothetical protein